MAEIFMEVESLSGKRHVANTERRTRKGWASQIKEVLDEPYSDAIKVRLVMETEHPLHLSLYEDYWLFTASDARIKRTRLYPKL